jgi:hypothetical protein
MRLTVLEQFARGVAHHDDTAGTNLLSDLERIKWLLWHGNRHQAEETICFFLDYVDAREVDYPNRHKFSRAAHEFSVYIATNTASLINYGERYRAGECISSCLAESTGNAVISKRFAKRQQMQWTESGARLLLQTRTRALDGTLSDLCSSAAISAWQTTMHQVATNAQRHNQPTHRHALPCDRHESRQQGTSRAQLSLAVARAFTDAD